MYEYRATIIKVVDGDTVDVDIDLGFGIIMKDERVRIMGIDTPESRTRDKVEKKFGLAAKKFVRDNLPIGSIQTLVTMKDKKGKFGRILGELWRTTDYADQSINEYMIEKYSFSNTKSISDLVRLDME